MKKEEMQLDLLCMEHNMVDKEKIIPYVMRYKLESTDRFIIEYTSRLVDRLQEERVNGQM